MRPQVLVHSQGYQQVGSSVVPGWTVWPTGASVEAGDDRMEKLLLTVREAADVLSVSRSRVYELIYAEQLDSVKLGRSRRVSLASVRRLAQGQSMA
jgi:excisionase family DNA binding protein